ncbi:DUF4350 domain-containing protein [Psychromicrobium sp. YIM B11713]|uniref:DUF4350 domain-containing protein n=1 Tax=Psychromicrobium sp. YIM B11713 TaxID=3145233 RepID=UPI00374EC004
MTQQPITQPDSAFSDSGEELPEKFDTPLPDTTKQRFLSWLRRSRFWLIIGGVFLLVVVVGLISVLNSGPGSTANLASNNPAPAGAMATAEILEKQGVQVKASNDLESTLAAVQAKGSGSSTVFLYDRTRLLSPEQLRKLAASGARIVVVRPGPLDLKALDPEIQSAGSYKVNEENQNDEISAQCDVPDAVAAGKIDGAEATLYSGPVTCFPSGEQGGKPIGQLAQTKDGKLTVVGNASIFSNERLAQSGNAALALRLLGHSEQLVWYLPSAKDLPVEYQRPNLSALQPGWLVPVSVWLLVVALLAMLWKGRRDGPLVEEPLPVIVKASETATGRARLYQDARALDRATASLRAAALQRLSRKLRLGSSASREAIVLAAAQHGQRPETDVRRILLLTEPTSEAQLLAWSQDVENLEKDLERDY